MGLDIDEVKRRLESLQKSNKKSNLTWKPSEKETTIRIVPYKFNPENPFIELYFHYKLNGKNYISPASFKKRDPIMEAAQKLKSTGDKEDWKLGRSLEPKLRTFAPIIVRGKEHEGVKFWGFGKTVYEDLLANIAAPDCGDITDPVNGRDVIVWTVKEEGKQFATPKVRIVMNTSKVTTDPDVLKKITEEQPDIKELYEVKSYEELREALASHLDPEHESESQSEGQKEEPSSNKNSDNGKTESQPQTTTEEVKDTTNAKETKEKESPSPENMEKAFADMFNK